MIDLTKPIRRKGFGFAARYWGPTPDGAHVISYMQTDTRWNAAAYENSEVSRLFENIPPEPETVCLYVWWGKDGIKIASPDPEDAQRWRDNGWKVSKHLVTEPRP